MKDKNFIFKPSKSNNVIWNLVKTFLQTIVFWFVFLYLIPKGILKLESIFSLIGFQSQKEIGWFLFFIFSIIGIYSGYTMSWIGKGTPLPLDCPNELVIQGSYKVVRNPLAVAGIGQGICVGIILGSYFVILYSILGAILWHLTIRPIEEKDLELRFGKPYVEYKNNVKCWIPKFK